MPDPVAVAAVGKALGKLFYAGVWAWRAREPGVGEQELHALSALVDAFATAQALRIPRSDPPLARGHVELVVAAFGHAYRRHWGGDRRLAPLSGGSARGQEVQAALERAVAEVWVPGDRPGAVEIGRLEAHARDPLGSALYAALWRAFSAPASPGEPSLLLLEGEGRRQFERHFLLAWWEGLASPRGQAIRRWLADLADDRRRLVRDLVQAHVAAGRGRHVFGDAANGAGPELPLDGLYVEPAVAEPQPPPEDAEDDGTVWTDEETEDAPPRSALDVLTELTEAHRVVVVVAPMGYGKSLTARMVAAQVAEAWLAAEEPSPEVPLAVPLRAVDLAGRHDVRSAVRRALQRHARGVGLDLRADDPALDPPGDEQRALFLLDGLDEVALSPRELDQLFAGIDELSSARHRWIVLSRPGALPPAERLAPWPIVELASFDEGRVVAWLDRWSALVPGPPLGLEALADRGLADEVRVPLLLFLVASTWGALPEDPHVGNVYEAFFQRVARGKHERDASAHPVVAQAARTLRDALCERGDLESGATPVDAMLWLMGRAAWEGRRLAPDRPLTARDVDRIVEDELRLREGAEVTRAVRVGLLLALQADLGGDAERVLFGHRSFEEFLVARYWEDRLRAIVRARERDWPLREEDLLGGRLLSGRTLDVLVPRLGRWPAAEREILVRWAEDTVNDERIDGPDLRSDRRAALREAALAIGSLTRGSPGLTLRDPGSLRSMLAWFFTTGAPVVLVAPGVRAPGADLQGVRAAEAVLSRAALGGASLVGAWMPHAAFDGAQLIAADLYEADLPAAVFEGADLRGATLAGADLSGAVLLAARMCDVDATRARLVEADLTDADLTGAVLEDAILDLARLDGACLDGAVLVQASLRSASLRGASLRDADLTGADLEGADLEGADLEGAEGLDR